MIPITPETIETLARLVTAERLARDRRDAVGPHDPWRKSLSAHALNASRRLLSVARPHLPSLIEAKRRLEQIQVLAPQLRKVYEHGYELDIDAVLAELLALLNTPEEPRS